MSGAIPPLPRYAFIAWCSVKKSKGTTLPLSLPLQTIRSGTIYNWTWLVISRATYQCCMTIRH